MSFKSRASKLYHQFPLPLTVRELVASLNGPRVLANSFPKGGTNLLTRVLSLMPLLVSRWESHMITGEFETPDQLDCLRRGQYMSGHLFWSQELSNKLQQTDIRAFFIVRDLRDIVVSRAFYITYSLTTHGVSPYLNSLPDDNARIMKAIVGVNQEQVQWSSIADYATRYTPWLYDPNCLVVRFEDLIGRKGGGDEQKQLATVQLIAEYLGMKLSPVAISRIAQQAFSQRSKTFRKGQLGGWKDYFTEEHKQVFKELAGELLLKFGYERDYDW